MKTVTVLVIIRLLVAAIFAIGAVYLMSLNKDGWGWCIFAAVILGSITWSSKDGVEGS